MKFAVVFPLMLLGSPLFAQVADSLLKLSIEDTLVVKTENKDVVELHIMIEKVKRVDKPLILYKFNKYVTSSGINDTTTIMKYEKMGLAYYIQDSEGKIIPAFLPPLINFKYPEDADKYYRTVTIVDEKSLKLNYQVLNDMDHREFNLAKIAFNETDTVMNLVVYPLLKEDYNLAVGTYYLTMIYNFKGEADWYDEKGQFSDENIFQGILKSNKVKLIVETSKKSKKR